MCPHIYSAYTEKGEEEEEGEREEEKKQISQSPEKIHYPTLHTYPVSDKAY